MIDKCGIDIATHSSGSVFAHLCKTHTYWDAFFTSLFSCVFVTIFGIGAAYLAFSEDTSRTSSKDDAVIGLCAAFGIMGIISPFMFIYEVIVRHFDVFLNELINAILRNIVGSGVFVVAAFLLLKKCREFWHAPRKFDQKNQRTPKNFDQEILMRLAEVEIIESKAKKALTEAAQYREEAKREKEETTRIRRTAERDQKWDAKWEGALSDREMAALWHIILNVPRDAPENLVSAAFKFSTIKYSLYNNRRIVAINSAYNYFKHNVRAKS